MRQLCVAGGLSLSAPPGGEKQEAQRDLGDSGHQEGQMRLCSWAERPTRNQTLSRYENDQVFI